MVVGQHRFDVTEGPHIMSMSNAREQSAGGPRACDETPDRPVGDEQSRIAELEHQIEGLSRALQTRDTIGQAKGILLSRYAMDPDEAFALLVRLSQNTNTKLVDLAADLVALARDRGRRGADGAASTAVFDALLRGTRRPTETSTHRTGAALQ